MYYSPYLQGGEGHRRDRRFTVYKVGLAGFHFAWSERVLATFGYILLDLEEECWMDTKMAKLHFQHYFPMILRQTLFSLPERKRGHQTHLRSTSSIHHHCHHQYHRPHHFQSIYSRGLISSMIIFIITIIINTSITIIIIIIIIIIKIDLLVMMVMTTRLVRRSQVKTKLLENCQK